MADRLSPEVRSELMRRVRRKDTEPEMLVRRLAHKMGFRYRLHRSDLPGKPDIVFPSLRTIIFVHGCFWHGHHCKRGSLPKSRLAYWEPKLERNKRRDAQNAVLLAAQGWSVHVVWQCETGDERFLRALLSRFLAAK